MKRINRILGILLSLLLLFGSFQASAATAEFDFQTLLEQGGTPRLLIVTAEPEYSLKNVYAWQDQYAVVSDLSENWYITDCSGKIRCKLGEDAWKDAVNVRMEGDFLALQKSEIGPGLWQLFNLDGRCLTESPIWNAKPVDDHATFRICCYTGLEDQSSGSLLLLDPEGNRFEANEFGAIYNGNYTYRIGEVWYAAKLFSQPLYSGTFDRLEFISDDLLICGKDGKYGLIRPDGTQVLPFAYEDMSSFSGYGRAERLAAKRDGKWGVIDFEGTVRIPFAYERVIPEPSDSGPQSAPYRGFYIVTRAEDGHEVLTREDDCYLYQGQRELPDGMRQVLSPERFVMGGLGLVDADGNVLVPGVGYAEPAGDNLLLRFGEPGRWDHYELRSNDLTVLHSFSADPLYSTNAALFQQSDGAVEVWGFDGTLRMRYENASLYYAAGSDPGPVVLKQGNRYALVTADGLESTGYRYEEARPDLTQPIVTVLENGAYYVVDTHGNRLMPYALDEPVDFLYEGLSYTAFWVNHKAGFLHIRQPGEAVYTDVAAETWYTESAEFCFNAGLMNGVGNGKFAPNETMTRAMLVQVLYNLSGSKCESHGFTDVPEKAWYADAVNWAAANGIVMGVSETEFGPNRPVTREQTMTILQRYAGGFTDVTGDETALDGFEDASRVSAYAVDPMRWAVSKGLIQGVTDTQLSPQGKTTRAQIATILMRFVKLMANVE